MPVYFKIDIEQELRDRGIKNPIGKQTIENIKYGGGVDFITLAKLCKALDLQPGDIIGFMPTEDYLCATKSYAEQFPQDRYARERYIKAQLHQIRNNP